MADAFLLQILQSDRHGRRGDAAVSTLDEYLDRSGGEGWNRIRDNARVRPYLVDDDTLEALQRRMAEAPASFFALLLDVAAKDAERREALVGRYLALLPRFTAPALDTAGYNLHEYCALLDASWLAAVAEHGASSPEGAWGICESAAMYRPALILSEHLAWMERHRTAAPKSHGVALLSLAGHRPDEASVLIASVLRVVAEHPAASLEAIAAVAADQGALQVPELVAAVRAHLPAAPEAGWKFFAGAAHARPELFDDAMLDALGALAVTEPGTLLTILRRLIDVHPQRARALFDRYVALVLRFPKPGIHSVKYSFQHDAIALVRPDVVQALCAGFAADAYGAYDFLHRCAKERPELIGVSEVDAALRNIPHATNFAFGFFKTLLGLRPEFTRECTLALFECLALEPVNRSFVRAEEMESLIAISEAAHIRSGLEQALREPPRVGSRRARALMAIMFRQKLRARRQVLLEALRYAATVVLWRKIPPHRRGADGEESEKFSPIWDFLMFIIDSSGDDAVSTASAESYLEGAFQLHYLCATGAEHEEFLRKFDIGHPPDHPFPPSVGFLSADAELSGLHSLVAELRRRFDAPTKPGPLEAFAARAAAADGEASVIAARIAASDPGKRRGLEERLASLRRQLACWSDPAYRLALADPGDGAAAALSSDARALLKREKKDLAKTLRDSLRAEATAIAVAAVERSRMVLYRNRVRDVLGRDVDIERVEAKILPAFLWFQAIGNLPENTRWLRRLIEDRIAGREHAWLRDEPAALAWATRVREARPGITLERWRAPFSKQVQYRAKDSQAEKRRRIKADLAQTRALLERAGAEGLAAEDYEELAAAFAALAAGIPAREETPDEDAAGARRPRQPPDPELMQEVQMNLERVRLAEQTPDSDYEGSLTLSVESDPFEILFMGEYGFASCLSLRGINAWSAVSNAIDVDKTVAWAREAGGNVVGRRLLALTPEGILAFRTYTNRHGLALDRVFDDFVSTYASHCGTVVAHRGHPRALLSDRWYDDGAL